MKTMWSRVVVGLAMALLAGLSCDEGIATSARPVEFSIERHAGGEAILRDRPGDFSYAAFLAQARQSLQRMDGVRVHDVRVVESRGLPELAAAWFRTADGKELAIGQLSPGADSPGIRLASKLADVELTEVSRGFVDGTFAVVINGRGSIENAGVVLAVTFVARGPGRESGQPTPTGVVP